MSPVTHKLPRRAGVLRSQSINCDFGAADVQAQGVALPQRSPPGVHSRNPWWRQQISAEKCRNSAITGWNAQLDATAYRTCYGRRSGTWCLQLLVRITYPTLTARLPPTDKGSETHCQEVICSQGDGRGGDAGRQGCSRPHRDSNNALLKGAITKRTLKGVMPASTARLTAALSLAAGKVLAIMSLFGRFYLNFFPNRLVENRKPMICSPFADPLPTNTYSSGEPLG